jgi:predicted AlkP superfamily phosphohydrolase/phosphomutase
VRKLVLGGTLAGLLLAGCSPTSSRAPQPRLVILGIDGLDASLTERWIASGDLPHMAELAARGSVHRLETTPSPDGISAWASFATGLNPGRHGVFGTHDRHATARTSHEPLLDREPARLLFDYIPIGGPSFSSHRDGTSFWVLAGRAGIRTSVLAVPVTFPPEEIPNGELLAGLPLPDLQGTPGTFHYFATDAPDAARARASRGIIQRLTFQKRVAQAALVGPPDPRAPDGPTGAARLTLPMSITWNHEARTANVAIDDQLVPLREREWSRWIPLEFRATPLMRLRGMAQMYLLSAGQQLRLYVSPIHWHPQAPPAPISSPPSFAAELFERLGPYRTLGWADGADPLEEGIIDEGLFLDQLDRAFTDRAETILNRIDVGPWDLLIGVVDTIDHAQHMLWRLIDRQHPMHDAQLARLYGEGIRDLYRRADALVGEIRARIGDETRLMVVSTYGFQPFRHAVDLNAWLAREGYLVRDGNAIDWSRTRVYAAGPGQLYLNRSREGSSDEDAGGSAPDAGQPRDLLAEISTRLRALRDPRTGAPVVRQVYRGSEMYTGPHAGNAADLQVGFAAGYRAAFEPGAAGADVIAPNHRKWSGDHGSVDYRLVPGLLITDLPVLSSSPRVIDLAPTVLRFLGVDIPADLDGRPLLKDVSPRP